MTSLGLGIFLTFGGALEGRLANFGLTSLSYATAAAAAAAAELLLLLLFAVVAAPVADELLSEKNLHQKE